MINVTSIKVNGLGSEKYLYISLTKIYIRKNGL